MELALVDEVSGIELGDKRLAKRLSVIVDRLGMQPKLSIPAAMQGRNDMEAAYRFFDNEAVTPDGILQTHYDRTRARIRQEQTCLLVQDTTEISLTRPRQQVRGTGPMSSDAQRGAFLHPLVAFTTHGVPLGTVWHKSWVREEIDTTSTLNEKNMKRKRTPIEEKESRCWIDGHRAALDVAEACPETSCVLVGDSGSDIYEVFAEPRETSHCRPLEILVRGGQERATTTPGHAILDQVRATACRYTATVNVSERRSMKKEETRKRDKERPARMAQVEVRACTVMLRPPPRPDRRLPPVQVNVVLVEETSPPPGQDPVQWMLISTLPIATDDQIRSVVEHYCQRWGIEVYFKTLKSGCRVEERMFETLNRELNCIAVYMIIAWRVLLLCRLGRECPDLPCDTIFETSEWKAVYLVVLKKTPPKRPPTLNEMTRLIASLGGFVARGNSEPGTQTLWIGMQRMYDFAHCYEAFGPGAENMP